MPILTLTHTLLDEMLAYVIGLWPEEACGLVGGRGGRAEKLYPVENVRHSPVAYEMAPAQLVAAMIDMEAAGLELVAIYHSHPDGPAHPSPRDVAQAFYPDAMQLIISLADRARPSVRAFTIVAGVVTEVGWEEESTDYTDITDSPFKESVKSV